jgi:hypothetical protein
VNEALAVEAEPPAFHTFRGEAPKSSRLLNTPSKVGMPAARAASTIV